MRKTWRDALISGGAALGALGLTLGAATLHLDNVKQKEAMRNYQTLLDIARTPVSVLSSSLKRGYRCEDVVGDLDSLWQVLDRSPNSRLEMFTVGYFLNGTQEFDPKYGTVTAIRRNDNVSGSLFDQLENNSNHATPENPLTEITDLMHDVVPPYAATARRWFAEQKSQDKVH